MTLWTAADNRPLVMHVVYRFAIGGLENGIVNLINHLPVGEFRHAVVALTSCDRRFSQRITRDDVAFQSLNKPAGQGWQAFRNIYEIFKDHRPSVVHTRNLGTLEMQVPAWLAGVPVRLHGEHGRDVADPDGTARRYRYLRRLSSFFVTNYVAVSAELEHYLISRVGIARERVVRICNGVDEQKFRPRDSGEKESDGGRPIVLGTVGRLQYIKGQDTLVAAIEKLLQSGSDRRHALRVQIVGDGPMRLTLQREIDRRKLANVVELLGERDDIAKVMRSFDLFVLPSRAEGMSNTILEAMASGLPVVATAVGGNAELVRQNSTGMLVPVDDVASMAAAIGRYLDDSGLRSEHGRQARLSVEGKFSLSKMVERYRLLYHAALAERQVRNAITSAN